MAKQTFRTETDTFGPIEVPADRYWGAQAQRSLGNFKIGWEKQPASGRPGARRRQARRRRGQHGARPARSQARPDHRRGRAGSRSTASSTTHFPLVVWQTGSGTQSNMNANEVISNRAIEMLGGVMGSKKPVHPNDHVNMSQSSNDTYPTAMHIACAERDHHRPAAGAAAPARALDAKAKACRPHHQDRPHPHAGRHAADARPGILRLCRSRSQNGIAAHRADAARPAWSSRRAAPRSAPASTRRSALPRRSPSRSPPSPHLLLHLGAEQVRGARRPRCDGVHRTAPSTRSPPRCSRSPTTSACSAPARAPASANCRCRRTSRARRSCRARSTRRSARR